MMHPVINNPESMLRVRVMVVKDYSESALKTLHKVGVLHIEESKELKPADKAAIESEQKEVSELLSFVNNMLNYVPQKEQVPLGEDVEVIYSRPFSEIRGEVKSLYGKVNWLYERTVKLDNEVKQLTSLKGYLEPVAKQADLRLRDLNFSGDYLFSKVFIIPNQAYEALYSRLKSYLLGSSVASVENETVFYVVARVRDQKTIESMITDAGGKLLPIPDEDLTLKEFVEVAGSKIRSLEEELAKLREELQSKVKQDLERLVLLREALSAESERLAVLEKAAEAKYVTLIEGWIPEGDVENAISEVKENINYVFIDTRKPEPQEEPPSKLKNLALLKPFELIVKIFEIPKYRGWDPTPIVAYSFAFFFGIMMADVIYGLGLIAVGKFLLPRFTDDPQSDNFKTFQKLVYTCSIMAIVFGLLNGSYMGDVQRFFGLGNLALVPVIGKIMGDPLSFIILAIIIGLIHINLAHLLALIKAIKDKNKGVALNRIGLFTLQLGLPPVLRFLLKVQLPFLSEQMYSILMYVMMGGIVLIVVSNFFMNGGLGGFLWIFDISGLFGDVVSYSRLAGVGLASFYLGQSFNLIVILFGKMFPGIVGAILGFGLGIGLFIVGHLLNLLLGGIGCFVHSLRLCFVEFLTKFYEGGGREYSPFKIRKRTTVLVSIK